MDGSAAADQLCQVHRDRPRQDGSGTQGQAELSRVDVYPPVSIFLWAFEGLQRLIANNFKFTESQRTRDNREAVKRDNNNVFDFLGSEGYIRLKADCTISSKDLYEIYRMWCEENNLTPLKRRSFSDNVIANQSKHNLEYCNKITNAAGRRVWGFFGIEAIARPNINGFSDVSERTYVPDRWQE